MFDLNEIRVDSLLTIMISIFTIGFIIRLKLKINKQKTQIDKQENRTAIIQQEYTHGNYTINAENVTINNYLDNKKDI